MLCKAPLVSCRHLSFVLLLITVVLTACTPVRPMLIGDPVSQHFAKELMQKWYESSARVISVQGLAKVKVHSPENSLSGTQVILAEKPDRLRAETLSPFGSPLLLLAADGENLGVLLPSQNLFYTGAASPANLGRFVRIPLRLSDLVSVLLYQPPTINALSEDAFELQEGGWLLIRNGSSRRQELTFNHERQLVEMRYYDSDKLLLKITYSNFSEAGNRFPLLFGIELPEQETTASLEFSDPEINGKLRPGIFQLTAPEGVTVIPLDEE